MLGKQQYVDTGKILNLLRGVEAQFKKGTLPESDASAMKLEMLRAEFDSHFRGQNISPLDSMAALRKLNASTVPIVPDSELLEHASSIIGERLVRYAFDDDLPQTMSEAFRDSEEHVRALKGVDPVKIYCPVLDDAIGSGLYPTHTLCLTGHEGSLKTSLALHMLENNVWRNKSVRALFCSLDMARATFTFRRVSRYIGVHETTVREMALASSPQYLKAKDEITQRDDRRLSIVWAPLTLQGLIRQVERTLPTLLFIDYITCIQVPEESDPFKALRKTVDTLRELREQANMTIVFLSQMSRASKLAAKSGQTGNHAYGGSIIEHLLDVEFEMVLDEPLENENDQKRLVVSIEKNRFGPQGSAFELEYEGVAKRITGRAWRLKKDTKKKAAFGGRQLF